MHKLVFRLGHTAYGIDADRRCVQAISNKKWDKSPDLLPDSSRWPTWGALRERILATCQEIAVNDSQACDDTFAAEVVKLSPPELERLDLQRNAQLKTFILAPEGSCPSLRYLNLSGCTSLEYLYVQSESLEEVHLSNCESLKKAVVHAPSMSNVNVDGCSNLGTLLLWTDELESLDLSNCPSLRKRQLYCPKLSSLTPPSSHQVVFGLSSLGRRDANLY